MGEVDFLGFKGLSKEEKYKNVIPLIFSLLEGEKNKVANQMNLVSALKYAFDYYLWVGFYFIDNEKKDELVVGPYQGKVACTRLTGGKGVCWASVQKKETVIVDDVDSFPGHIACDSESKSEIVMPVIRNNEVIGVLDVDSGDYGAFDEADKKYLEELISKLIHII